MTVLAQTCLQIEPNALAVRAIGPWLRRSTEQLASEDAAALVSRAELAVHEACMNVIDHANPPAGSMIDLQLVLDHDDLCITLRDAGAEFDPDSVDPPQPRALLEGGYGLTIIRSLVSELSYRRRGTMNELELRIVFGGRHERA